MKIVIISQHFPPENSGNASRVSDMAQKLAELGAEVTVIAPHPTFPTGTFRRTWAWRKKATVGSVSLVNIWAWQPRSKDPGFISRIAYYLTFPLHAALWTITNRRAYDVLIGSSPPVFTVLPGLLASRRKHVVIEVRDLWIDAAVSLGFAKERGFLTRLSRWLEGVGYRRSSLIAVTTEEVAHKIRVRYPEVKAEIIVVPNGVDTRKFQPLSAAKKRQFVYAGNIGHAQDLEKVIDAIAIVRLRFPDVKLVIAGDGDTRDELEARAMRMALNESVEFPGILPRERIPQLYAESIAGLAPLRNLPTLEYAVPTKAYESLGCGVPFIGTGTGEIRRLADASGGGIIAENSPESIAESMMWLIDHPDEAETMAKKGRSFVAEHYERGAIARKYHTALEQALRE